MNSVDIAAVGICAPGLPDWTVADAALAGVAPFAPDIAAKPAAPGLPPTERRRANATTRWALAAAVEAVDGLARDAIAVLPTVFASADGDGEVLAMVLRDLAHPAVALSPTTFHNSVYNAPAGYWSIASGAPSPSTTLCAGAASFAAGLLEAIAQVAQTGGSVLLVAYDLPFPDDAPIDTPARCAFACALLLAPSGEVAAGPGVLEDVCIDAGAAQPLQAAFQAQFDGNAAAAALPLLAALARGHATTVTLPYLDDTHVTVRFRPCR